ncbi:NitT/TauT family transport system substrate-binding protein [Arthrobacter sp. V4I6]|uniref:ABC transporter substrate-binding protein n=1 Tax=unclassified Arthrobacter TaxID=235627 RepID=UPI00278A9FA7|nr:MULTISPECIES: ABC transporter substrate-binding protein [unclassified Arthrobacter]MDQ0821438.1 NitT/TauT family transport system substrate-binding protein [Arthrobacter sp. V1I7]MDQ0855704.1 NitT/TauT family transport system substrate-binding protein [Arthrobacter sp. V4I6]
MKRPAKMLTGLGAVLALALTACSPGTPGSTATIPAGSGELKTVKVVGVPVVDMAALYVGEEQGFFAKEGLDLNIEFGQGTAAMIPALLNGQYDVQYGGSVNLLQAVDAELPVVAIAAGGRTTGMQGKDHGGLLVLEGSPIKAAADLEGKTIAVNALRGLHEVALWASVRKAGGDPAKVKFVEMPLPDMGAALANGQIDAASVSEPFLGVMEGQGARLVTSLYVDADPDFVTALYFVTAEKAEKDPAMIEQFNRALEKSFAYSTEHPDAVRAQLGNFTQISPGLIETMTLTNFKWGLTYDNLHLIANLAADAKSMEDPEGAAKRAAAFIDSE